MDILERIKEMERQLEALKAEVTQEKMAEQWEPEGGEFLCHHAGFIVDSNEDDFASKVNGCVYKTEKQAEKAAAAMRTHNRLLAYVAEFAPDYDSTNSRDKCLIRGGYPSYYDYWWCPDATLTGVVYMPRLVAEELCRKLNSGEVVL